MEHTTHLRVLLVDCWFFVNSLVYAFIMAWSSLVLMHSSSLSPTVASGDPCFDGMVSRKQRAKQTCYRLVKPKLKNRRWKHGLSQASYPAIMSVHCRWQSVPGMRTRRVLGDYKVKHVLVNRRCSLEGKIWWLTLQICDRETKLNKC
jgi:hypothetical protein